MAIINHVQLMVNGTFENGGTGWTTSGNTTIFTGYATLTSPSNHSNDAYVEYTISLDNAGHDKDYNIFYVAVDVNSPGGSDCILRVTRNSDGTSVSNSSKVNGDYTNRLTIDIGTSTELTIRITNSNGDLFTGYTISVKNTMLINLSNCYWPYYPSADEFLTAQKFLGKDSDNYWANGVNKTIDTDYIANYSPQGSFETGDLGSWNPDSSTDLGTPSHTPVNPPYTSYTFPSDLSTVEAISDSSMYGTHAAEFVIVPAVGNLKLHYITINFGNGHKLYACAKGKTDVACNTSVQIYSAGSGEEYDQTNATMSNTGGSIVFFSSMSYPTHDDIASGMLLDVNLTGTAVVDGVMWIDTTEYFGSGYEPSRGMMDKIILVAGGYWNSLPSAPSSLTGTFRSNEKVIDLRWVSPNFMGGTNIESYNLSYKRSIDGAYTGPINYGWTAEIMDVAFSQSFEPNTHYDFKLTAINSEGEGPPIYLLDVHSPTPPQPNAPTVNNDLLGSDLSLAAVVDVHFSETSPTYGVTSYRFWRSEANSDTNHVNFATLLSYTSSGLYDNYSDLPLLPSTRYYYKVSVVNAWGESARSISSYNDTYPPPNAPASLTGSFSNSSKTITLNWPKSVVGSVPVQSYHIYIYGEGSVYIHFPVTWGSTDATFSVDKLDNVLFTANSDYRFSITAHNVVGESGRTSSSNIHSPIISPATITSLVPGVEDGSGGRTGWKVVNVTANWSYGATGATYAILNDIWLYRSATDSLGSQTCHPGYPATTTLDNLSSLEPGTDYWYTIRVYSVWGTSDSSRVKTTTISKPQESAFDANLSTSSILLSWTAPVVTTYLTGYRITRDPVFPSTGLSALDLSSVYVNYNDVDFASVRTYKYNIQTTTNLWSSSNLGLGVLSAQKTVTIPEVPNVSVDYLGGSIGSYSNIFYNKVVWQIPSKTYNPSDPTGFYNEDNYLYKIYRSEIDSVIEGNYTLIGTTIGRDTVFYDGATAVVDPSTKPLYIKPNTYYYYKVKVSSVFGDSPLNIWTSDYPIVELLSPSYSQYAINNVGTNGSWKCTVGMGVDSKGKPTLTINTYSSTTPNSPGDTIRAEISEGYGPWKQFGTCAADAGTHYITATAENASVGFGRTYRLKMRVVDSTGKTTEDGESNIISITTYSNNKTSFPNMMPNSGMQYGTIDVAGTLTSDTQLYEATSYGSWAGYNNLHLSINDSPIYLAHDFAGTIRFNIQKTNFYSDRAAVFYPTTNVETNNYIKNIASFKFPTVNNTSSISSTRYYCLSGRAAKECSSTAVLYEPILSVYRQQNAAAVGSAMELYILTGTGYTNAYAIDTGSESYVSDEGYADLFVGTYSDNSYTQQSFFKFKYENAYYPWFLVHDHLNAAIGDLMLFDLSSVFGGNGGDIEDTSSTITSDKVYAILNSAMEKWWDFDYETALVAPPSQFLTAHMDSDNTKNDILTTIQTVNDRTGGLDLCGYLPVASYSIQYKREGEDFFGTESPITFKNSIGADIERQQKEKDVLLTGTEDGIQTSSVYQIRYSYSNGYGESYPSEAVAVTTRPIPGKVSGVELDRFYDTSSKIKITWGSAICDESHKILKYEIMFGSLLDETDWATGTVVATGSLTYPYESPLYHPPPLEYTTTSTANKLYYCKVRAINEVGNGEYSEVCTGASCTFPTVPTKVYHQFANLDGLNTHVIFRWDIPEDDGCSLTGTEGITGWVVQHGTSINISTEEEFLGPTERMFQPTYTINVGSECYFRVAAITNYTESIEAYLPGTFTDIQTVKFMVHDETVKIRGYATSEGYIDFYFTARTDDGTQIQYPEDAPAFWRLLTDKGTPISENVGPGDIQAFVDDSAHCIFKNGITDTDDANYELDWPTDLFSAGEVITTPCVDIFGEALKIKFTMPENSGYLWDVGTQQTGLDGIGSFLIVTDYTTDVSFYDINSTEVDSGEIVDTLRTGSLIWTINAAFKFSPYKSNNEHVPQVSKEFVIIVRPGDVFYDINHPELSLKNRIESGTNNGSYGSLQNQINQYFTGATGEIPDIIAEIYQNAGDDTSTPFTVDCSILASGAAVDGKNHLKVNIKTLVEQIQNQISCKTTNLKSFYLKTKANTYYVANQMNELRSFEDMYGRNKPGSSTVTGDYTKRSYGFRFNLDYIQDYTETEASTIDITPIPGMSSGNSIGLDIAGTTRAITIKGVRIDNSNDWMFHAPWDYLDKTTNQVVNAGIIYMGTSNWGWCKFMKAIMGTFQFIDGPYRLIMMTVPSSLMQQYVPERYCKFQYPDGTYIVQAGTEDMCYVMIEQFTTTKDEDKYNAIEYQLTLKRVIPLGSVI